MTQNQSEWHDKRDSLPGILGQQCVHHGPKQSFLANDHDQDSYLSLYCFELGTYTYQNRHFICHPGISPIPKISDQARAHFKSKKSSSFCLAKVST